MRPKETITMTVEKLAGLGDGAGMCEGRKIFIPYTVAGDVVRAVITRKTVEADFARVEEILKPGPARAAPVCKHFSACGGCALQHVDAASYREFKQQMARQAVRKAGYDPERVEAMIALPAASRRRVALKVARGEIGFYEERSHKLVDIEECKVLEPALLDLVLRLKRVLGRHHEVVGIQINGVDNGYDVVLECNRPCTLALAECAGVVRMSAREGETLRTLFESAPVTVTLGEVAVAVPPAAFLQASLAAQTLMMQWVAEAVGNVTNVVDLFAGIGTYGLALSSRMQVTAVEGDEAMVAAMQRAGAGRAFTAQRRDLFTNPLTKKELSLYDAIILNPPRTGAKAQVEQIAGSGALTIVMVSCNPATFARDARILREGGYRLQRLTPVDQFVYSSHLELLATFCA